MTPRLLVLTALGVSSLTAGAPSTEELSNAYSRAVSAWGMEPKGVVVRTAPLGSCETGAMVAWSDFVTREIVINSSCHWDTRWLRTIVAHEVGHMLHGQGHSTNRHSVMFPAPMRTAAWQFFDTPHVTRADRGLAVVEYQ